MQIDMHTQKRAHYPCRIKKISGKVSSKYTNLHSSQLIWSSFYLVDPETPDTVETKLETG